MRSVAGRARDLVLAASAVVLVLVAIGMSPRAAPPVADQVASAAPSAPLPTPSSTAAPSVDGMRIALPRLGIDLPLAEGDVERDVPREGFAGATPEGYAFHLPGTSVPGTGGNTYIYAHARVGMFLSLWNARLGDEVLVRLPRGDTLRYVVTEIHPRVPPSDTAWVQPTADERLTLQTSTGPVPEDPRFVVIAERAR